jgi:hypothetical protein
VRLGELPQVGEAGEKGGVAERQSRGCQTQALGAALERAVLGQKSPLDC